MSWLQRKLGSVAAQITAVLALASVICLAVGAVVFMVVVSTQGRGANGPERAAAQMGLIMQVLGNVAPERRPDLAATFRDAGVSVQMQSAIPNTSTPSDLNSLTLAFDMQRTFPLGASLAGMERMGPSRVRVVALLPDGQPVAMEAEVRSLALLPAPLLLILVFLFVSATLLSIWAGRRLVAPLARFAAAVDRFDAQAADTPLKEEGPSEIRQAARAFNRMRDRIVKLIGDRTRMLMAISHDLRTPLTRLRLRAEELPDGEEKGKMLDDIRQMDASIHGAVEFLREGVSTDAAVRADLASLVETICDQFSDMGFSVQYRGPERLAVDCQPGALSRAVTNLVDNAAKYGSSVVVSLASAGDGQVTIEVADDGPGIPDSEKERVLQPFYRSDAARQNASGFGLGLPIALAVALNHSGALTLHDCKPRGLRARLQLSGLAQG
jgi:signal transduction histidine kinase